MSETPLIQVEATPRFQRNLRKLAKKYFNIRKDIQPVIKHFNKGKYLEIASPKLVMKFLSYA